MFSLIALHKKNTVKTQPTRSFSSNILIMWTYCFPCSLLRGDYISKIRPFLTLQIKKQEGGDFQVFLLTQPLTVWPSLEFRIIRHQSLKKNSVCSFSLSFWFCFGIKWLAYFNKDKWTKKSQLNFHPVFTPWYIILFPPPFFLPDCWPKL